MGLIVVEGPDGAGKTTLIRNLRNSTKRHFLTLHRSGPPGTIANVRAYLELTRHAARSDLPVICDRHPLISEPIYGQVLRGHNLIEQHFSNEFVGDLLRDDVDRIIYCRPRSATIRESLKKEKQLDGIPEHIDRIIKAYDYYIQHLEEDFRIPTIYYSWNDLNNMYNPDIEDIFFGEL